MTGEVYVPVSSDEDDTKDVMLDVEVAGGILEYLFTYEYASERSVCLTLVWHALLRHGTVRALDVDDYDPQEMS